VPGSVSEALAVLVRRTGLATAVRHTVARRRASILLYHDPSPDVLERHLDYLAPRYNFVRLGDLVDAITCDDWASLPPRALVLTFDDGHRGNVELRDLFVRYGVRPTIYICSQIVATNRHYWFLETDDPEPYKPLSNNDRLAALEDLGFGPTKEYAEAHALQIREIDQLKDAVDFAAHSRFHPILTACSDHECANEIEQSRVEVEALVDQSCPDFSYPNGDYGSRELALVQGAHYRSARTVDLGWNDATTDPFALKILGTSDTASVNRLAADLTGVSGYLARLKVGSFRGKHRPALRPRSEPRAASSQAPP